MWHAQDMRNKYKISAGTRQGKRTPEKHKSKWEGNIKTDLKEMKYETVYWIHLVQDRDQWKLLTNIWFHETWGIYL